MRRNPWIIAIASSAVVIVIVAAFAANGTFPASSNDDFTEDGVLQITGLVDTELSLSIDDLRSMPNTTIYSELICVSGYSFGFFNWTGVSLGYLLGQSGIAEGAIKVAFYADDGYSTDLTIDDALREDVIVAYERDGELMQENLKLVVPGKWGYKWINYLNEIELVDYDFKGVWESKGYPDDAEIE